MARRVRAAQPLEDSRIVPVVLNGVAARDLYGAARSVDLVGRLRLAAKIAALTFLVSDPDTKYATPTPRRSSERSVADGYPRNTRRIASMVLQLRVVAGTPNSVSSSPR
jgi:hypothetical protein